MKESDTYVGVDHRRNTEVLRGGDAAAGVRSMQTDPCPREPVEGMPGTDFRCGSRGRRADVWRSALLRRQAD